MTTVDKLIRVYRKIRDTKDVERKAWDAREKDLDKQLARISNELLRMMQEAGVESYKTEDGTAFRQTDKKVFCEDWNALYDFIRQDPENRIEAFLEKRVKKQAALDYAKDHEDQMPPGCLLNQEFVVRVRAPAVKVD